MHREPHTKPDRNGCRKTAARSEPNAINHTRTPTNLHSRFRSQFVQALLLSTLSLDDTAIDCDDAGTSSINRNTENVIGIDDNDNSQSLHAPIAPCDYTTTTTTTTTTTNNTANTGPRDEYEAKKQHLDSASSNSESQRGQSAKPKTSKPGGGGGGGGVAGGGGGSRGHRNNAPPQQASAKTPRELKASSKEATVPGDTR